RVTLQHHHAGIAAAVDPAAAGIGPVAGAAAGRLAGRLVTAGHVYLPGGAAHVVGRVAVGGRLRPLGIVVLVTILLVDLRDDAARLGLGLALPQHPGVLRPGPLLERREAEPRRRPILVLVVYRMASGQVAVRVGFVEVGPGFVGPGEVAVKADVVAEVPGNVRKRCQAVDRVAEVTAFVVAV